MMADMLERLHARFDPTGRRAKKMFGGACFMLNGNMVAGTSKRGMLVRIGKDFDTVAERRVIADHGNGRQDHGRLLVRQDGMDDVTLTSGWMPARIQQNAAAKITSKNVCIHCERRPPCQKADFALL